MSVIFNIDQSPLTITPSNAEHIWTISSPSYTLENFKYIIDVYFRDKVAARLKVRPNSYGKAIVELEEIVRTFLKANPRFSGQTYPYLNYVAEENSVITLSDAQKTRTYNAYNVYGNNTPNGNLEQLWHIEQYKVVVGCEYTSGSTIIEDIVVDAEWQPSPINIFPGVDNTLIPEPYLPGATLGSGYTQSPNFFQVDNQSWLYYDLFRHIYKTGPDEPDGVSNCNVATFYGPEGDVPFSRTFDYYDCYGVFKSISVEPNTTVTDCVPSDYSEPYVVLGAACGDECSGPREFLNAAGRVYKTISQPGIVSHKVRTRMHHPDCPIIISFLDGENDYFSNNVGGLVIRSAINKTHDYSYSAITVNNSILEQPYDLFKMGVFYLPYNVTYFDTLNAIPTNSEKVCFYLVENPTDREFSGRTSEVLEFDMQERSCINNPTHLLFLNGRGMWDTYTFGGKQQKTYSAERKKYQQEASIDKQFYARGSSQRGSNVYEINADYEIKCKSWYMDQNDVVIVEEIFTSPEVYIITGTTVMDTECQTCHGEIRLYQHLIPVVVKESELMVYKKHYQKLYQYEFTLQYGSVKRYRTQG
jgi:hypothetical protein